MEIKTLSLLDFRNYREQEITFCPGINVIYGNNAQGKTNLLEAVYLFSHGKSPRAKTDAEMIRFGEKFFRLSLGFSDRNRSHTAQIQVTAEGKKSIKVNNVAIGRLSQLMRYLNVVMFSPQDLEIVKGSPSVRRRFLDEAISQLYPGYLSALSEYHKALSQKNSLLKMLRQAHISQDAVLSVWNEQLAVSGSQIVRYRQEFLSDMAKAASEFHAEISKEKLKIDYTPSIDCGIIEKEAQEIFLSRLEANQAREIEAGAAQIGIQRDDFKISVSEKEARLFASQGQQRTAVLSLKLAQTEYVHRIREEYPVLLLDDIMSELDIHRREYLSERIQKKQVLLTSTDTDLKESTGTTKLFRIDKGRLVE